ncbi:GGDEF domain-containing phosphodiesterase [Marivita sp. XM-24bin2]|jgi:diguanylate cyclase (GGDEF)-like protein|uniref:GGDEF domain-containing phosphodiesterase n=1 Tax=unclassified Marivita TaxID=2632480 RepID=UPI0025C73036|nr:GGDEF domain-containing phosphodiesterase [Marivita sp. XM-24bin2]MCR9110948.1 GGDEF domain-containing phosphodiesterase [Paracoccaceae bacterium]
MLAFLPALCLAAYWLGGEALLVLCALTLPVLYALTGSFAPGLTSVQVGSRKLPELGKTARDFLEIARHNGQTAACLQIAIPELKDVAHRCGADAAQQSRDLLAARLRSTLRDSDYVFQSGETRFIILIAPGFRLRLDSLIDLGKRLRATAEMPLSLGGASHDLTVSIGIASSLTLGRNATAEKWLSCAEDALNDAQAAGAGSTRLWSERLARQHKSRRNLQHEFEAALDTTQVHAHFQPQVHLETGAIIGVEAFARWEHPTRGVLSASSFLPFVQDGGHMMRLGRAMFLQSVSALLAWDDAGLDVKTVSVNLSETELRDPELPKRIAHDLERCGLPAHRIVFDIPVKVLSARGDEIIRRTLDGLGELGCGLDLEGVSSAGCDIALLQHCPITRLKLDRTLMHDAGTSDAARQALHAILGIAERLDLPSVATGVETVAEHGVLRELGAVYAQGALFAPPADIRETTRWLTERQNPKRTSKPKHIRSIK